MNDIKVGYVRVSSRDQNEARQIEQMKTIGIDERHIFVDKESGKDFNREQYKAMISMLREGDEVYFTSLDRMGRNYDEIAHEWERITKEIKANIIILDMPILDTREHKDLTGQLIADIVLKLLSYVAENERQKIRARQAEGIAIAKAEGKYTGRKPITVDKTMFEQWYGKVKRGECSARYAMSQLNLKTNTYYRFCHEFTERTGLWA